MTDSSRAVLFVMIVSVIVYSRSSAADVSGNFLTGYKGGLAFAASCVANDFASGFPLGFEFTVGYASMDPGNAEQARGIFINDATDGTPEKKGYTWDFSIDFLYRLRLLGVKDSYLYAGVHRIMFTGNFHFVGGNEDFDVTTNEWGVGAGLQVAFPMGNRVSLAIKTGIDNYFASSLYGHDTSYSPDGQVYNGKHNFTWADADRVINRPKLQFSGMIGLNFAL